MTSWTPILAFDCDDNPCAKEFVRGFEAGSVCELARRFAEGDEMPLSEPGTYMQIVHTTNAEMILRIAERHDLAVRSEELGDGWLQVYFTRTDGSSEEQE